jgi:hypothetical protein
MRFSAGVIFASFLRAARYALASPPVRGAVRADDLPFLAARAADCLFDLACCAEESAAGRCVSRMEHACATSPNRSRIAALNADFIVPFVLPVRDFDLIPPLLRTALLLPPVNQRVEARSLTWIA